MHRWNLNVDLERSPNIMFLAALITEQRENDTVDSCDYS
jgi:hypothetical protein